MLSTRFHDNSPHTHISAHLTAFPGFGSTQHLATRCSCHCGGGGASAGRVKDGDIDTEIWDVGNVGRGRLAYIPYLPPTPLISPVSSRLRLPRLLELKAAFQPLVPRTETQQGQLLCDGLARLWESATVASWNRLRDLGNWQA